MTITETTPPVKRKFNLELDKNELQLLGLIAGAISPSKLVEIFKSIDDQDREMLGSFDLNDTLFSTHLYNKIIAITHKF